MSAAENCEIRSFVDQETSVGPPHGSPIEIRGRDAGGIRQSIIAAGPALAAAAAELGASPAQFSLAFCYGLTGMSSVLVGTRTLAQLEDNIGSYRLWQEHARDIRRLAEPFWFDRDVVSVHDES